MENPNSLALSSRPHSSRNERHRDTRSQSPPNPTHKTHRHRSPHSHHHHHSRRKHRHADPKPTALPENARQLVKEDFRQFRPLLALYLDIQKGKDIEGMDEVEVRGRWARFVGKWNRGELANGYYDAETFKKAVEAGGSSGLGNLRAGDDNRERDESRGSDGDSDEEIGPVLPPGQEKRGRKKGATIPNMQDLEMRRETSIQETQSQYTDLRHARKSDLKQQKEQLEELLPRPSIGRDRQLEKKKLVNEKMQAFREKSPGVGDVPESELMGGDDGLEGFKRKKMEEERKKSEREIRFEERRRAEAEEREERLRGYREKEEGTVEMLRQLARQRFGGGG